MQKSDKTKQQLPAEKTGLNEIRTTIADYPSISSALLPSLHITQREHGWLPSKAIEDLAVGLELSSAHIRGVATFHFFCAS